jgi:hypothetical protein
VSDGAFHGYVGMLVVSALVLSVLAARGFGQSAFARVVDGVFAAVFLGYAGYLMFADPGQVLVFYYAVLAPVYAVVHVVRNRPRSREVFRAPVSDQPTYQRPAEYHPTPGYQAEATPAYRRHDKNPPRHRQ